MLLVNFVWLLSGGPGYDMSKASRVVTTKKEKPGEMNPLSGTRQQDQVAVIVGDSAMKQIYRKQVKRCERKERRINKTGTGSKSLDNLEISCDRSKMEGKNENTGKKGGEEEVRDLQSRLKNGLSRTRNRPPKSMDGKKSRKEMKRKSSPHRV